MTAPTKTIRTPAETGIIERFGKAELPGSPAVRDARAKAFAAFERQGLPNRRVEEWKYSDLRARLKQAPALALRPSDEAAKAALVAHEDAFAGLDRYRLVLVDGFFVPSLSDADALAAEGIRVSSFAEAVAGADARDLLAVPVIADDIALSLNTAFAADGVVVTIPKGQGPSRPLHILHVATGSSASAVYARSRVVIGDGVEATVLESALGGANGSEINLATDYSIGRDARVTIAGLQAEDADTTHIGSTIVTVDGNSEVKLLGVTAGSSFARNQTFLTFAGQHARAQVLGVGMVHGTRHVDNTLVVDHAVPHCTSAELFKTVVDDRGTGVFQGKIFVRQDAQKTAGKMMSQGLLLSEEAEMHSKPELEIYADDVICGHGATVAQIDATSLFYLMARGIPRAEAEQLLIEAFLDSALDALENEAVTAGLRGVVSAWLGRRNATREAKAA